MAALLAVGCYPRLDGELHTTRLQSAPAEFMSAEQRTEPRLVDVHGQEQRPFEESDARAIVLVFMIHDCPIANSYIPALNRLYDSFEPRGIRFLLLQADPQITLEQAREHAQKYEIKVPVVLDAEHFWVNRAGATKSPQAVVLSPNGNILYSGRLDDQYAGLGKRRMQTTSHDLSDAIEAILASRPIPRTNTEPIGCDIPGLSHGE